MDSSFFLLPGRPPSALLFSSSPPLSAFMSFSAEFCGARRTSSPRSCRRGGFCLRSASCGSGARPRTSGRTPQFSEARKWGARGATPRRLGGVWGATAAARLLLLLLLPRSDCCCRQQTRKKKQQKQAHFARVSQAGWRQ